MKIYLGSSVATEINLILIFNLNATIINTIIKNAGFARVYWLITCFYYSFTPSRSITNCCISRCVFNMNNLTKPVTCFYLTFFLIIFSISAFAQLPPSISYTTPQALNTGVPVSIAPTNANAGVGGDVPAQSYGTVSTFVSSGLSYPETMVGDASGNLYVCDVYNNTIKLITPAGVVSVFAGSTTGASGFTNGTGTAARFNLPNGIAIDAAGNLYVADYSNNAIRKITTPGAVVTTLSLTGLSLNQPAGLAFNQGYTILYVSEQAGNDIKQINISTLACSAYAGSGTAGSSNGTSLATAQFNNIVDMNADNAGNLFVMDYGNNEIREISGTTNLVTTFAGATTAGYVNATGTSARFNGPYGLVIDGANNIYIGDSNNDVIRMVTSAGVVTLFAGAQGTTGTTNGTLTAARFNSPLDMYINSSTGLLYVCDYNNALIRQIAISGYTISPATLPAGLSFNSTTGVISGTPTATSAATNYTITAYNYYGSSSTVLNLSVTNAPVISYTTPKSYAVSTAITTLSPTSTGGAVPATTYATVSTLLTGTINNPRGLTTDAAGNIYEADFSGNKIYKITSAGAASVLAGSGTAGETDANGTSATFNGPTGIVYDGSTYLYVADYTGNKIRRIAVASPFTVTTIAGNGTAAESDNTTGTSASFKQPYGITYDGTYLYVSDLGGNTIRRVNTTTPYGVTTIAGSGNSADLDGNGTAAQFKSPAGITYDGQANLFVADELGNTIRQITTASPYTVTTFAGSGAIGSANGTGTAATFSAPYNVCFDASGNLIVADEGNNLIRFITSAGVVSTLAGSGTSAETNGVGTAAAFKVPYCVTADASGNLYVGDNSAATSTIRKVLLTGYTISPSLTSTGLTFTSSNGQISGTTSATSSPSTNYTITAYNASGSGSAVVNITVYKGYTWVGGTLTSGSALWTTAANWSPATVPSSADQALIGTASAITNNPVINTTSGAVSIGSIQMGTSGGKAPGITVTGTTLTVSGDITYTNANTTAYTATLSGTGAISANNLNISNTQNAATYVETLTASVNSLSLAGNVALTTTYNNPTKYENATFNFTGATLTLNGLSTTNANAGNTSTISLAPTSTLNITGATAFSGLSATGTNTLTISSPTIGYTGTGNQTVYNSTAISNSSLTSGISYTNILFSGSGIKTVLSNNLNVSGNFTNSLTSDGVTTSVDLSSPTVNFTGSSAQSITDAGGGTGTTFYNVNMSGGGTKTLASGGVYAIASSGLLTLSGSTTFAAGTALLTLNSDATGSAGVATIPSGAAITGTVYVQRFVTGGVSTLYRGYRTMSSPVSSTGTTGGLVDLSYIPASTPVTGAVSGASCTACTVGGNPSLFLYNESVPVNNSSIVSGNFQGVVDINGTSLTISAGYPAVKTTGKSLTAGNGIYMFFRGDNINNLTNKTTAPFANPENVTFTALGTLNQGSITVKDWYNQGSSNLSFTSATGSTAQGFHLVGNPYANSIDWHKAFSGTSTSGIYAHLVDQTIYVYNVTSKTYSTYLNTSATAGTAAGPPGGSNIIPSGQGFFVHANAAGAQLIFNEDCKVSSEPSTLLLNSTPAAPVATDKHLRIQLYKDPVNIDESVVIFNPAASNNFVLGEDASYLKGSGVVGLSNISADNVSQAISQVPFPKQSLTIPLNVYVTASGTYGLNATEVVNIPKLYDVWLKDAYQKDSVNVKQAPNYSFVVNTGDTTTFGTKRFSLTIRQNPLYAYQLLTFTGVKVNNTAQLSWTTQNEDIYTTFLIQRSTDGGKTFSTLATIPSTGTGSYSYIDSKPVAGQDQYRLQQVDVSGNVLFSNIVMMDFQVSGLANAGSVNIFPNPVGSTLNINIISTNNASATYNIQLTTSNGDVMKTYTATQTTWQGDVSQLRPGVYIIKVVNNADKSIVGITKFIKL